jgi:SAM-dependent methyltransferase
MVVTGTQTPEAVAWHDLECGSYRADLPLWRELAADAAGPDGAAEILDVGAGTGRVTLDLARQGHRLTAVDLDAELLAALRARAGAPAPEIVCADARELDLARREHALCIVPMQTLQLLGGAAERARFLSRARAHVRPGGLVACAIVTELEAFDFRGSEAWPIAEQVTLDGMDYRSRAIRVAIDRRHIRIERERSIRDAAERIQGPTLNVVDLDRVSARRLLREGRDAGMAEAGVRTIPATDEHVASEVVLLRV